MKAKNITGGVVVDRTSWKQYMGSENACPEVGYSPLWWGPTEE